MVLDTNLLNRLLSGIEAGRLLVLCGAGLSMPPPSSLMSAVRVARACYDRRRPIEILPPELRDDIGGIAAHFFHAGQFQSDFIEHLVPWNELVAEPNEGNGAVADLLITRAVAAVLSANFDPLVEQWAERLRIAMQGAINGVEAMNLNKSHNPLLKFHGCLHRRRQETFWTDAQLEAPETASRIQSCSEWMKLILPGKDLLIVGFWTDWAYLNKVLASALSLQGANSITVIDPLTDAELKQKAPELWDTLTTSGVAFQHVRASSADALDELRRAFSVVWLRKFYLLGKPAFEASGRVYDDEVATSVGFTNDDLYRFRQDGEGTPYDRAASKREPPSEAAAAAFTHLLLLDAGAGRTGAWFERDGQTIRVVNGGGQDIGTVSGSYREPPTISQADIVICAGAADLGVPARLIPAGAGASIVRPNPGLGSRWLTLEGARAELAI